MIISNMMEQVGVSLNTVTLEVIEISSAEDFRSMNVFDSADYALGMLDIA
ncbi:MAG: hypothetical protein ABWY05_03570 [Noviherbaspirillum sp.]